MNIEKITKIVTACHISDESKRRLILAEIATDEKALPDILEILAQERANGKELIQDLNLELSRMSAYAAQPKRKIKGGEGFTGDFVFGKMWEMYAKWGGRIGHLFNMQPPNDTKK